MRHYTFGWRFYAMFARRRFGSLVCATYHRLVLRAWRQFIGLGEKFQCMECGRHW